MDSVPREEYRNGLMGIFIVFSSITVLFWNVLYHCFYTMVQDITIGFTLYNYCYNYIEPDNSRDWLTGATMEPGKTGTMCEPVQMGC